MKRSSNQDAIPAPPDDSELYVVGIGASTGGLEALRTLFSKMPVAPNAAFVIVTHMSSEHEGHLAELLQPHSSLSVQQVTKTVKLKPGHVYVIPPNANLDSIDTHLRLSSVEERRGERAPIDHFLRTLAATHAGSAVAVILTGGGSDGALGIRRIQECGGLTIVQDPRQAASSSMPRNALGTGMIDLTLPLSDIARTIVRYCATRPRLPSSDAANPAEEVELNSLLEEVRVRTGQDLGIYTRARLLRRMRKRMQLSHVETLGAYLDVLRIWPGEARALCDDLLVNATEFFRNADVFDCLEHVVLPELFTRKSSPSDRLRAWSIGCSTGEEAYSLAMLMLEEAGRREVTPELQVFASDVSPKVLARAREALYPEEIVSSVSSQRLERFFKHESGQYRVRREVHDIVVFAAHDLLNDPPFGHLDLIVCVNRIRDLQPAVRRGLLSLFHYALEPQGVLVVADEDEIDGSNLFTPIDGKTWVFRRAPGVTPPLGDLWPLQSVANVSAAHSGYAPAASRRDAEESHAAGAHDTAKQRYMLPSILIDAENRVVHYSPSAGKFVRIPGGEPTRDVEKLVQEPLTSVLQLGIDVVRNDGRNWQSEPIALPAEKGSGSVVLHIDPLVDGQAPGRLLVVFDDRPPDLRALAYSQEGGAGTAVEQMRAELDQTDTRLRDLLEARRADEAEVTDANSDLQTLNEELRNVLLELKTSRADLQSVNEELAAVDQENRRRLEELTQISADLQHLLESTGVGALFLDRDLNIVRFTPQIAEIFNIRKTDISRRLTDLTHNLEYHDLAADARRVLQDLTPVDREIRSKTGRWYLARVMPYRTAAQRVDGVVLTAFDITDRKRAEESLRDADRRKDSFLAVLAHELRNPLAPITSSIAILRARGDDPDTVNEVSAVLSRQTQQLVRLVDDLLEVSRITTGKLQLRKSLVRLVDTVRDALAAVRPLIDRADQKLAVVMPADPITLDADAARLTQVFTNLLHNAVRHTPRGGRLEVVVGREGDDAVVKVRDNGVGISPAAIEHVFEMFYQVDDAKPMHESGLGIGLTLAKSLVEMHGGSITVDSAGANSGTEFRVRLPISKSMQSAQEQAASPHAPIASRRVLIVDDNVDAAETLGALIGTLGEHEVHIAMNGAQGLRLAAQLRPEIVLMDLMMPGIDGYELAQRIRQEPWGREPVLVALTGWGQAEDRRRTKEAGFDEHLTKPADVASLEAVLGRPSA